MAEEETAPIKGVSFTDPTAALRLRDAVHKVAAKAVKAAGSNGQVARVMSVDIAKLTATVWYPGDSAPVTVKIMQGNIPLDLGDYRTTTVPETGAVGTGGLVWIEDFRGEPTITRILSGGEFGLDQRVAGLTHQAMRATRRGTVEGSPVAGIYERHVTIELNGGADFTSGKAMLVGPWSGKNDGSSIDGIIELTLSFWVAGSVKNQVRKYQFSVSDRMIVDLEGDEGNKPFWMRLLPETNLGTRPHAELAVDVALVKTNIRTNLEFWFRLVPLDTWADQSAYFMSVKTYGAAFNLGDPNTGRVVAILDAAPEPVQGWLGFHNAGMGWTERDEYASFPVGTYFQGDEWSTGSWRSSMLRAAANLAPLWTTTGQWIWGTDNKLNWEGNIVFTGIGPNWNGLHTGMISVPFPDTSVPVFPANPADFGTQLRSISGGILLNEGDTLYYGLCPGQGTGGQGNWQALNRTFFIVDSKTYNATQYNFSLPEWAIPIAHRTYTANSHRREFIVCSPHVDLDDRTQYTESVYTSQHTGIVGSDETETMDVSSFRFKKKTAYAMKIRCGYYSSTTNFTINWRIRKGTTDTSPLVSEINRVVLGNSTGGFNFEYETIIVNDTTSDIVTPLVITGQSNSAAAATWTRYASSVDPAVVRVDQLGPASKYLGWPKLT